MTMRATCLFLLLGLPAELLAQRAATRSTIISPDLPKAIFEAAPGMVYAGTQTFDLYGVANAEQHFFVELDGTRVKRLLWIQFEGYHPDNTSTYTYRDTTIVHSGHAWHRRISATRIPEVEARPESDGARARAFLKAKGWTVGPDVMLERLVWLLDVPARNELMVIYMEDLADRGLTAADLTTGSAQSQWSALADALHLRALASFAIRDR
ncbi:MAG TPA: hypothetical protein VFU23_08845 [Gemmatimonadales bacterium]|nr:hypothetical protein [Gemmatimonadales bacterium]